MLARLRRPIYEASRPKSSALAQINNVDVDVILEGGIAALNP